MADITVFFRIFFRNYVSITSLCKQSKLQCDEALGLCFGFKLHLALAENIHK